MTIFPRSTVRAAVERELLPVPRKTTGNGCDACRWASMVHCHDPLHCGGPWSDRALQGPFSRDQEKGLDAAVRAAAQALGIDEAVVREAIEGDACAT